MNVYRASAGARDCRSNDYAKLATSMVARSNDCLQWDYSVEKLKFAAAANCDENR